MYNRIDLYFSYWILLWAFITLISNITFPFITITLCFLAQYYYINKKIYQIINSKFYVIIGNFAIVFLKYILIIFGIIFKTKNYKLLNEIKIGIILFILFNIYYYLNVKKIYYVLTFDTDVDIKIEQGPSVNFFKFLLN